MGFSFTDIIVGGTTIWGDVLIILTLISAVLMLLGGLIARLTQGKPPRWSWQWEAFTIGFVCSAVGYGFKLFSDDLPIGAIFRFSRLTAGLLIFAAAACVGAALLLIQNKPVEQPQNDET